MLENGKIIIEVYKEKKPEEFTKFLADKNSRVEAGSASALTAAQAAALAERAAAYATELYPDNERAAYIAHNLEILRGYMVNLIDEDVKCRGPLRKAMQVGEAREIEACRHPACAINEEVINMMTKLLDFNAELIDICPDDAKHLIGESVMLAQSAMNVSRIYVLNMVSPCKDETYKYVTRRENELTFDAYGKIADGIMAKVNEAIK